MNFWIIGIIAVGILAVAGLFLASPVIASEEEIGSDSGSCSQSCGNSCTADNNCGRESCGVNYGKSCGCS